MNKTSLMKENNTNAFGLALKEVRKYKNLTQANCSVLLKISQAQWSSYELGTSRATLDAILAISEVLGVEPLVLIGKYLDHLKYPKDKSLHLSIEDWEVVTQNINDFRENRLKGKIKILIEQHAQNNTNVVTLKELSVFVFEKNIDPAKVSIHGFSINEK
jgi:transcriptional regulator with XRE-family HTH domain